MAVRTSLFVSAALVLLSSSFVVLESVAHACSPPHEPGVTTPEPGIHAFSPLLPGALSRDGGILFDLDVRGEDVDDALTRIEISVTDGGEPIAGALRPLPLPPNATPMPMRMQFVPSAGGMLPVTDALSIEVRFRKTAADEPTTTTFAAKVDDTLLGDFALPQISLELGEAFTQPDAQSTKVTCVLAEPMRRGGGDCGGGPGEPVTETTFFSALRRFQGASLRITPRYDHGVSSYVAYDSRVTSPGMTNDWSIGGYFSDGYGFVIPGDAKHEVCFEVTATSSVLDGFPKSTRACVKLTPLAPVTAAENEAHVKKMSAPCASVSTPPGTDVAGASASSNADESSGGCSTSGRGGAGTFGLALVAALSALSIGRRRRTA